MNKLLISPAPHISKEENVPRLMYLTLLFLLPPTLAGIYFFGTRAFYLILVCILTALITELLMNKMMKKDITVLDGSAAITGLLLALSVTPKLPYYAAVIGTIFAIVIGKQLFGGLGYNIFNPALIARAFLAAAFPVAMTTWQAVGTTTVDTITTATPLALMKFEHKATPLFNLFVGNVAGSIGETSTLLIIFAGLFLMGKKIIEWRITFSYLGTVAILSGIFWMISPTNFASPFFHLFSGGLMLGAFFMATDLVTSPITKTGAWIFGLGAGILLVVIRNFSGLSEGVMYSILIMNALTPLINRFTRPRIFGRK